MVLGNSCTNKLILLEPSNTDKCKVSSSSNIKFDCVDCLVFKRKLKENEQTVSSRDVLIEMLQGEIQKIQNLYKRSIDDYEKLRFIHCSTVHDYSNLKDIYRKIEAENEKLLEEKKTLEALPKQLGPCKNENGQPNAIDDSAHIENIMQAQNQSLKLLLSNFLEELKNSTSEEYAEKSCQCVGTTNSNGNNEDAEDDFKAEVEKLRQENNSIRENLNAKQEHLSKCLDVLEKNHIDIGNLSSHIENICCERDKCMISLDEKDKEIANLQNELENLRMTSSNTNELKIEIDRYRQENNKLSKIIETYKSESERKDEIIDKHDEEKEQLHDELVECRRLSEESTNGNDALIEELKKTNEALVAEIKKLNDDIVDEKQKKDQLRNDLNQLEEHHLSCKCDYEDRIYQLELFNENLRETLTIVTTENKSNLNAKEELSEELKKVRNDLDECQCRAEEYKKEIDNRQCRSSGSRDQHSQTTPISSAQEGNDCRENPREENMKCQCSVISEQDTPAIESIIEKKQDKYGYLTKTNNEGNDDMLEQLEKKVKSLQNDLDEANLEISEYEEENKFYRQKLEALVRDIGTSEDEKSKLQKCYKECDERQNKMRQEFSVSATEKDETIKQLKNEIDRLTRRKSASHLDETKQSEVIENLRAEKTKLELENEILNKKIKELGHTLTTATDCTEEKVLILAKKIEILEKQDEDKQKRLENCCDEMDKIQISLKVDVSPQKEDIDKDIIELKNINIAQAKEIDDLKNSIKEYTSMINNCNCMNSETNSGTQDYENNNQELKDKIQNLEKELNDKQCTIVKLEECLDNSDKILADSEKELKLIHQENERLKNDLEVLRSSLEKQTCESEMHKTDRNLLEKEISETRRKSEELEKQNTRLINNNTDKKIIEDKIVHLQEEYNKLLQESKEKDVELEKITKQFKVLQNQFKQPNMSRDELMKLKRVSQEIKSLVTDQFQDINKVGMCSTDPTKFSDIADKALVDGKKAAKNDNIDEIKCLQCKNEELSEIVAEMKEFMKKIMIENENLKLAITNLLKTLMNKIKVLISMSEDNFGPMEVLDSIPKMDSTGNQENYSISTSSKCNCMDIIKSGYNPPQDNSLGSQCIPCGGACNEIMDKEKITTIMDVRRTKSNRPSGNRKVILSCDSRCESFCARSAPEEPITKCVCDGEN